MSPAIRPPFSPLTEAVLSHKRDGRRGWCKDTYHKPEKQRAIADEFINWYEAHNADT